LYLSTFNSGFILLEVRVLPSYNITWEIDRGSNCSLLIQILDCRIVNLATALGSLHTSGCKRKLRPNHSVETKAMAYLQTHHNSTSESKGSELSKMSERECRNLLLKMIRDLKEHSNKQINEVR
jgi:hypothetical protein